MIFLLKNINGLIYLQNPNRHGYGFYGNSAEIYSGTVTGITVTVQKKIRNRSG